MGQDEKNVSNEGVEKVSLSESVRKGLKEVGDTFVAFFNAPRALWGINIPYLIEGLVYFGLLTILVTYCSENVGLSDIHSGWVAGFVTGGITFAMLLLGGVSDKLGVRVSLALSLAVMMVGRAIIGLSGTLSLGKGIGSPMFYVMIVGLFFMVISYGLYMPAAYAGVKRYTNPKTAAIGYAVIYGLMNLGAFFSGIISPNVRHFFANVMPPNGLAAVVWVYTGLTLISSVVTLLIITKKVDKSAVDRVAKESAEMTKDEPKKEKTGETVKVPGVPFLSNIPAILFILIALVSAILTIGTKMGKYNFPMTLGYLLIAVFVILSAWEFLRRRADHPLRDIRFVYFIFILIFVQTLFAHTWLTIPIYLQRAFPADSAAARYFEFFSNLNPIIIFIFAPIVAAFTARANVYKMMIIGTTIMAAPTFLLVLGPNVKIFVLYIILMSIGEAMWQPRFLQWVAEIAPEGKTGMYMGIGQFPWFLTKMITASYSGYFVSVYLPKAETGMPVNSETLWLFYALIAMVSPVALWLAKGWMVKGMKQKS